MSTGSLLISNSNNSGSRPSSGVKKKREEGLTVEEMKIVRHTKDEYSQRGGFVRVFPTLDSWELYG